MFGKMSRILKIGLLASTMLALTMPASAQPGEGRGNGRGEGRWTNSSRQQAPQQRQAQQGARSDGGERQRNWSSQPREQRAERPQVAAPSAPGSAVGTTRVPPSNAGGDWRRLDNASRSAAPGNDRGQGDRGQSDRGQDRQGWNGNRDRAGTPGASPVQQYQRDRNNDGRRDWNGNDDRRPGNARSNDNRTNNDRRDWSNNNNGDRRWNNNDRNDRNWNYQRRLNDRDRWAGTRRWDNGWRSNSRYDWQRYRTQNRSIYHMPSYYAPYGWNYGYRRFSIGIYLSNMLFAQNYWLDDPYEYRLPPAYGSLRWVRYYDDAMLVDIRDGYVVDVIHGFFW
jgi:hypothetical protein